MEEIGEGIVIGIASGVASGLILTLILWRINCWRENSQREDQIKYISNLIINFRENIYHPDQKYSDLPPLARSAIMAARPLQDRRNDEYESFRKRLDSTLEGRADHLNFDEIHQLRVIFLDGYIWRDLDNNPSKDWYDFIFEWAESVEWLKIPPLTKNNGR